MHDYRDQAIKLIATGDAEAVIEALRDAEQRGILKFQKRAIDAVERVLSTKASFRFSIPKFR